MDQMKVYAINGDLNNLILIKDTYVINGGYHVTFDGEGTAVAPITNVPSYYVGEVEDVITSTGYDYNAMIEAFQEKLTKEKELWAKLDDAWEAMSNAFWNEKKTLGECAEIYKQITGLEWGDSPERWDDLLELLGK